MPPIPTRRKDTCPSVASLRRACQTIHRGRTSGGQALYLIGAGQAGFTLIEVIIVVILTGILGTFTFYILSGSTRTFANMATRKERADDALLALEKISREVRDASSVSTASGSTLAFTKKNAVGVDSSTTISYTLSSGVLERYGNVGGTSAIVAKNVSSFTVSQEASNRITMSLAFSSGSSWQTKVSIRNGGL